MTQVGSRIMILGKPSFECLGAMDYPQAGERSKWHASVKNSVIFVLYKSSIYLSDNEVTAFLNAWFAYFFVYLIKDILKLMILLF